MLKKINRLIERFDPLLHLILLFLIGILIIKVFGGRVETKTSFQEPLATTTPKALTREEVEEIAKNLVSEPVNGDEEPMKVNSQSQPTARNTAFISLGDTYSTKKTDWTDVEGSEIYIDFANDYGEKSEVYFEANLKVEHASGQSFVRVFDDTNKITVIGSELSTQNNSAFTRVSSTRLYPWRGRNLYKLQIKSLNSNQVTVAGGKLKIVY